MTTTRETWAMPKWMEEYRELINNTGGNSIEELVNNHETTIEENAPLALICVAVKCQVGLLQALYKNNLLKKGYSLPLK